MGGGARGEMEGGSPSTPGSVPAQDESPYGAQNAAPGTAADMEGSAPMSLAERRGDAAGELGYRAEWLGQPGSLPDAVA